MHFFREDELVHTISSNIINTDQNQVNGFRVKYNMTLLSLKYLIKHLNSA